MSGITFLAAFVAAWPAAAAPGEPKAGLYLCAETVLVARIQQVRVRGAGFVALTPEPTPTPSPVAGTPAPNQILEQFPVGKIEPEREVIPLYDAELRVEVVRIESDKGVGRGMLSPGETLSLRQEGLPHQPEYHPRNVVRLKLRLHANEKDPRKASYRIWQLVEASPALSDAEARATPPIHLHPPEGDLERQAQYAREFLRAAKSLRSFDGLRIPDVGAVSVEEKGGVFTCLIGAESVARGRLAVGAQSADLQAVHDFVFHERPTLSPEMIAAIYKTWKFLRASGVVEQR